MTVTRGAGCTETRAARDPHCRSSMRLLARVLLRISVDLRIILRAFLIGVATPAVGVLQAAFKIFVTLHADRARLVGRLRRDRLAAFVTGMFDWGVVFMLGPLWLAVIAFTRVFHGEPPCCLCHQGAKPMPAAA
ncbi:hypothetical protein [Paraburkholderia bannensis]|uniref:hypothetical protein n=1 Tax=Paraburkholderia bannensis TaxID=765414 RepID=UPI0038BAEF9D